jgi:predicted XRE-type DNA-binding protein
MKTAKRAKLQAAGYRVTTAQEFLGLSDEEMAVIEIKRRLIDKIKRIRTSRGLTQRQVAELIGSSQSRVAMVERGCPDVSLDLICRCLFALGVSRAEIGRVIAAPRAA